MKRSWKRRRWCAAVKARSHSKIDKGHKKESEVENAKENEENYVNEGLGDGQLMARFDQSETCDGLSLSDRIPGRSCYKLTATTLCTTNNPNIRPPTRRVINRFCTMTKCAGVERSVKVFTTCDNIPNLSVSLSLGLNAKDRPEPFGWAGASHSLLMATVTGSIHTLLPPAAN